MPYISMSYYQAFDLCLLAMASLRLVLTPSTRPAELDRSKSCNTSSQDLGVVPSKQLQRPSTTPKPIPPEKQNLVPLYLTQICMITLILIFQIGEWSFLFQNRTTNEERGWDRPWPDRMSDVRTLSTALGCMYTVDLWYRSSMKRHTQIHHLLAIGLILYMTHLLETTQLPVFRDTGLLLLLQGTTEQLTLLGLIGLKRKWSPKTLSTLFFISSLQTGTIKLGSLLFVILRWMRHLSELPPSLDPSSAGEDWWDAQGSGIWVFALGLVCTQIRSSPISLAIKLRTLPTRAPMLIDTNTNTITPTPTPLQSATKPIPIQTFQVVLTEMEKMGETQVLIESVPTVEMTDIEVVL